MLATYIALSTVYLTTWGYDHVQSQLLLLLLIIYPIYIVLFTCGQAYSQALYIINKM